MSKLTERVLFLKFVRILKLVKLREFQKFLKFIKFEFSIHAPAGYAADDALTAMLNKTHSKYQ